jgi:hypothetical protein
MQTCLTSLSYRTPNYLPNCNFIPAKSIFFGTIPLWTTSITISNSFNFSLCLIHSLWNLWKIITLEDNRSFWFLVKEIYSCFLVWIQWISVKATRTYHCHFVVHETNNRWYRHWDNTFRNTSGLAKINWVCSFSNVTVNYTKPAVYFTVWKIAEFYPFPSTSHYWER